MRGSLKEFYGKHGIGMRSVLRTPLELLNAMDNMSRAVEEATRLGEFKRMKARGRSARAAAYGAREISTDFSVRGASEKLNGFQDTVMFLSAGMAGMERAYRGLAKGTGTNAEGRRKLWLYGGMLAAASTALYAVNRENPWYQSLEDWDKDAHWHLFVRTKPGDARTRAQAQQVYQHYRVPKFWDIGALASLSERLAEMALGDERDVGDGLRHTGKVVADQFKLGYIPAVAEPLLELGANKSFFSGGPIESPAMQKLPPEQRSDVYTSELGRGIGEATKISPKKVDHLLRGYFGFFGSMALSASDAIAGRKPAQPAGTMPGVRRFTGRVPGRTQEESDFWNLYNEQSQFYHGMKRYAEEGDAKGAKGRAEQSRYFGMLKSASGTMAKIRTAQQQIMKSDMTPEEKRAQLDRLQTQKNEFLIGLMRALDEAESE